MEKTPNRRQWKRIREMPALYAVSDDGCVARISQAGLRLLRPGSDPDGYQLVCLCKLGVKRMRKVHQLVAEAFIPNIHNKPTVNHKNGKKDDNRVENLEWATHSEQLEHANTVLRDRPWTKRK